MTYEDFISRFEKRTPSKNGVMTRCPAHADGNPSLHISPAKDGGVMLYCFGRCKTEDIVAALGLEMKDLFAKEKTKPFTPPPAVKNGSDGPKGKSVVETTYSYTDGLGKELFQVVRMKPKDFYQRHKVEDKWVNNMTGVERVLYRLPEVMKSQVVWVTEGEKDADKLVELGFCATCNVGGAGKWLDGYTATLIGKDVIICGDNDKAGREHVETVFKSIASKARSVKLVKVPSVYKDAGELIAAQGDKARAMLIELDAAAVAHYDGIGMPVYSMAEIEPKYHRMVTQTQQVCVDLGDWLPSLRRRIRPLTPGTLVLIAGNTGAGKTMLLQNIALSASPTVTLLFEMELGEEDLYERFWANKAKCECVDVEAKYREDGCFGHEAVSAQFPNLYICPEPKITIDRLESIILKSELKIGAKPLLVLIDYVQLVQGEGKGRYEKVSNIAESLKVMAKSTKTIIIIASQVDRASGRDGEIGLHSAKDSGSLENSAGLVMSAMRDDDPTLLRLKILKSTKGGSGYEVLCNIDGAKATITERSRKVEE